MVHYFLKKNLFSVQSYNSKDVSPSLGLFWEQLPIAGKILSVTFQYCNYISPSELDCHIGQVF